MNLNILAYIIYLLLTASTIIYVGNTCYQNGKVFIQQLIPQNHLLAQQVNKILLLGYYLLNLGYCATTLIAWYQIEAAPQLVEMIAGKMAKIIVIIAVMHYFNIYIIKKYIHQLL